MSTTEIALLRLKLSEWSKSYYAGSPVVPDSVFDTELLRLSALETASGAQTPDSPTAAVGSDLTPGFRKVQHVRPMLSLENVFDHEDAAIFFGENYSSVPIVVEPKVDGVSLALVYGKDGRLAVAITRGDGTIGDDVTEQALMVAGVQALFKPNVEVRGEVYMPKATFKEINADLAEDDQYANPRNLASGSLKQLDPAVTGKRGLKFVAYWSSEPLDWKSQMQELEMAGFATLLAFSSEDSIHDAAEEMEANRDSFEFEIDGAVPKIQSYKLRQELGLKTKSPRWACAWKFKPQQAETELLDIIITVGKTGRICPNAVLNPVTLAGANVKAASMMNRNEMERIGWPSPGSKVIVERSADVIPRVVGVSHLYTGTRWEWPTVCPECNGALVRDGVHYFCRNTNCHAQVVERLAFSVSKRALDWDGFGIAQVECVVDAGCTTLSDIFELSDDRLNTLLGAAALTKFKRERELVKTRPLWRKLLALNFAGVGAGTFKDITAKYSSLNDIVSIIDDLPSVVGEAKAECIMNRLVALAESDEVCRLHAAGFILAEEKRGGSVSGKFFVITGALTTGTRDAISAMIEQEGGIVKSSVSKATSYLVAGEEAGGTKMEGAKKRGTQILNEVELYALLGRPMPDPVNLVLPEDV